MRVCIVVAAAAALASSAVLAQSVPEKTGVNTALGIAPKTQDFVTEAANGDMLEIASSKLALTRSDNARTRQFADKMIKDHTETSTELKGLVSSGKVRASLPAAMDKTHQGKLDDLAKLNGEVFTRQYDEMQLTAHKDAVSLFERYAKGGADDALKQFAGKTLPHLQEHLKMAQELGK
jgi:putative membrane protein